MGLCSPLTTAIAADTAPKLQQQLAPEYPADAPVGATGTVDVRVEVDTNGMVTDA